MSTGTEWFSVADAKRSTAKHRRGHVRLGNDFTACGHPIGYKLNSVVVERLAECQQCQVQAAEKAAASLVGPTKTLRDEFAMAAPVDFTQALAIFRSRYPQSVDDTMSQALLAVWATARYEYADAMLAARASKP